MDMNAKPLVFTKTFCVTKNTMDIIKNYQKKNECSMSDAVRALIRIADEAMKREGR